MLSTPNTAPVGSPRELVKGGSAWNARYRYDDPSTRTRSGRVLMGQRGRAASCFFFSSSSPGSGATTSGAGEVRPSGESTVWGEFGASVDSPGAGAGPGVGVWVG